MLRVLTIHERLSAFGRTRRAGYNKKPSYSTLRNHGPLVKVGLPASLCRLLSRYKIFRREHASSTMYRAKASLDHCKNSNNFSSVTTNWSAAHHAQNAWKKLSFCGTAFPRVDRIAFAVSFGLLRSHVVPGVLALLVGEAACTQRALADGEYFPTRDTLYDRAQDSHIYLTSVFYSLIEGVILVLRVFYLAILFSPALAMAPFADSFGIQFRKKWLNVVHATLERAGPAFIKWGQWAATRPDLFPSDLCSELTKLHSNAPAHKFSYTKRTVERAFNRKLSEIFVDFEEEPIASGSIAQIHRATLKYRYRGKKTKPVLVAVKVRHPGVGEAIRRDFIIINVVAKISTFVPALTWLRLDESVQQFAVFMMSQVDLAREAAQLSRFIYNFRSWKDVSFPRPLYPLVHPAVLVETYEKGDCVSHYVDKPDGNTRIKSALAHIGTHALLKMLLVDNFIHADMHPGNILVRVSHPKPSRKQVFKSRPHIIFLDVGMTAELSKSDRVNLLEFFKAVALRDGHTAAECTLKLSKQQNCPNPKAFIEELERTFTFWGTREGDIFHPAECMHQLLEQVRRHKVNIDGNICTVMVTILVLEGWQRKLDPEFNVMQTLQTLLFKADWAKSLSYTIEGLMAP
uniref:ABC1 family protein YPL109C, mitochondrial n=1 Tax=Anthurium amnicola TaxID=1678845 RepID=A0A1D1ZH57_9ARAE